MTAATGMAEWGLLLLSECLDGQTFLRSMWNVASRRRSLVVTDCKSLFDHVSSMSAPTLDDRRTALDIVILRESLCKTQGSFRWEPRVAKAAVIYSRQAWMRIHLTVPPMIGPTSRPMTSGPSPR